MDTGIIAVYIKDYNNISEDEDLWSYNAYKSFVTNLVNHGVVYKFLHKFSTRSCIIFLIHCAHFALLRLNHIIDKRPKSRSYILKWALLDKDASYTTGLVQYLSIHADGYSSAKAIDAIWKRGPNFGVLPSVEIDIAMYGETKEEIALKAKEMAPLFLELVGNGQYDVDTNIFLRLRNMRKAIEERSERYDYKKHPNYLDLWTNHFDEFDIIISRFHPILADLDENMSINYSTVESTLDCIPFYDGNRVQISKRILAFAILTAHLTYSTFYSDESQDRSSIITYPVLF